MLEIQHPHTQKKLRRKNGIQKENSLALTVTTKYANGSLSIEYATNNNDRQVFSLHKEAVVVVFWG